MADHVARSKSPIAAIYDGEPPDLHLLPCDEAGKWAFRGTEYTLMRVWEPVRGRPGVRRARFLLLHPAGDWLGPVPLPAGEYELRQVAGDLDALRRVHGRA